MSISKAFKGKILVARPHVMRDPGFAESVVYLYEETDSVVLGLVLNKPSTMSVADIHRLRGYQYSGAAGLLYKGGPVSEQSLLMLHTDDWQSTNTMQVTHGNCISSDELMLDKMVDGNLPSCWRLMSGMSTWSRNQLISEVYKHKAWLLVEPNQEIFYNEEGLNQWKQAIKLASERFTESLF